MDLIIKPTEICNFKCTFCSSTDIATSKASRLELSKIFQFLKRFPQTRTIIVNGGDPLILPPQYYYEILTYLQENGLKTSLSLTTNLWDFYKKPEKWTELFRHPQVGVSTSFNYGTTRRITTSEVYTEDIFWKVSNLFLDRVGYRPSFISVVTDENCDTAIDNVYLAQKMNVECKLNYAMASGDQSSPFVLSKIYEIYLEIYNLGLSTWEFNTKQMIKRMMKGATVCPQNRDCDSSIRCLQPDGDYYSCGAFGDDKEYEIDFEHEVNNTSELVRPLEKAVELASMKSECFSCPMFDICNGCKKTIKDLKKHGLVEDHCTRMKKIAPQIESLQYSRYSDLEIIGNPLDTFER
jgi:radical SAM protein with 4Fe4S-binding SPASM domain